MSTDAVLSILAVLSAATEAAIRAYLRTGDAHGALYAAEERIASERAKLKYPGLREGT